MLWLLVQLSSLAITAWRIPLAAAYPQPAEFQAIRVMLAVQFAWATMLMPTLLRGWRMALATVATGTVMLVLAAGLSAWSLDQVFAPAGCLVLWIMVLALWRAALPASWRMAAAALATLYSIGGCILWYLRLDLAPASGPVPAVALGPLFLVLEDPHHPSAGTWVLLSVLAGAGFLVLLIRRPMARLESWWVTR